MSDLVIEPFTVKFWFCILFCLGFVAPAVGNDSVEKRILIVGDSIAAGYGLDPSEGFPALLQQKINTAGLKWKVQNAGVSGDTSAGGVRRIEWLLKQRVDLLILELGGNDGLRGVSPEATKTNLQEIITRTKAKYPEAKILLAGMQMPANMGSDYTKRFADIYPELAKENKAALAPFLLEGVGGIARLNQPDRIHPTAEGHEIIADNLWKVLKPLLDPS